MSPLLTVMHDLLPQGQKEEERTILDLRDEMKMCVVEEEVGIGIGKGIEDMSDVAAKRIKLFKKLIKTPCFYQADFSTTSKFDLGMYYISKLSYSQRRIN